MRVTVLGCSGSITGLRPVELFIVHMEAGREENSMREILRVAEEFQPAPLQRGRVFEFYILYKAANYLLPYRRYLVSCAHVTASLTLSTLPAKGHQIGTT